MVTVKSKLWHTIKTQVVVVSQEKRKKKKTQVVVFPVKQRLSSVFLYTRDLSLWCKSWS